METNVNPALMPLLFLGHGSPMNAIEENDFVRGFRKLAETLPRPRAILCVSAHWETDGTAVTAMEMPRTIHDFGGFPKALFEVQYPAPGSPGLAEEVRQTVTGSDVQADYRWGLDHGTWSVIKHLYPNADIPVVQLSLDYGKTPQQHYDLGKELLPLRRKGALIVGSGNLVHNLRMVDWRHPDNGFDWAETANEELKKCLLSGNVEALIHYKTQEKNLSLAVPTPEHFLPMLYVLGLRQENEPLTFFNDRVVLGSMSMTSFRIG